MPASVESPSAVCTRPRRYVAGEPAMSAFDTILCPVDFSEASARALRYAAAYADRFRARLIVLHVIDPILVNAAAVAYRMQMLEEEMRAELDAWVATTVSPISCCPSRSTVVSSGRPCREILKLAERETVDLIVMGTHGRRGCARLFEGSATARLLRQTSIPTLVVPVDASAAPCGADGPLNLAGPVLTLADPDQMSSQALHFAWDLARALGASLFVAESGHATPPRFSRRTGWDAAPSENILRQRLFERRISRLAKKVRIERLALPGEPLMAIVTAAAQQRPGLIVVGTAGGMGQQHQLSPRVTYQIICLTCLPVLVIPAETSVAIRRHHESHAPLAMVD